ncbi:type II secretion system protein GspL [Aquabacterium sp. A08]|uniref:type II secretion system protein GspL n=1 Tax=Aquabacterium sp. A08 TaxID=2718532 RepID=UPI0014223A36|nr:hypothetical protein [Aquabacterium sp. A08]
MLLLCPTSLPAPDTVWTWARLDPERRTVQAHGSAGCGDWPRGGPAQLCLPPDWVSWHRVQLPRVNAAKLHAALLGQLEDHLLSELDAVHLALPPDFRPGPAADTWVAVCHHGALQACLRDLQAAGQPLAGVLPALVPGDAATVWVHDGPDGSGWLGLSGPQGVLSYPLPADDHATADCWPLVTAWADADRLRGHATADRLAWARSHLPGLDWTPQPALAPWLHNLQQGWNLAQFALAQATRSRRSSGLAAAWRQGLLGPAWRPARWGLAGVCLANLLGLNAVAWQERAAVRQLERDTQAVLRATFPQLGVVLDAPLQMQREVAALRQGRAEPEAHDLAALLSAIGRTDPPAPLEGLRYNPHELVLRAAPAPGHTPTPWQPGLQALGWTPSAASGGTHTFTRTSRP